MGQIFEGWAFHKKETKLGKYKKAPENPKDAVMVSFGQDVPPFVDSDQREHPFRSEGEIARVSKKAASFLVKNKLAVKMPKALTKFYNGKEKCQFCGKKATMSTKIKKRWFVCKKCYELLNKYQNDIKRKQKQLGIKLVFPKEKKSKQKN